MRCEGEVNIGGENEEQLIVKVEVLEQLNDQHSFQRHIDNMMYISDEAITQYLLDKVTFIDLSGH